MLYILISIIAGSIVVISRILNTKLSQTVGLIESSFFNYLTGLLTSFVFLSIFKDEFTLIKLGNIPFYAYFGGLLGIIVVILSSVVTTKMSSFYITLIIFVGQLFSGIIIDCLIYNTISLAKIFGGILVVMGLAYNLYVDFTDQELSKIN